MSPNRLLERAMLAMLRDDFDAAIEALRDLADWIDTGGNMPNVRPFMGLDSGSVLMIRS